MKSLQQVYEEEAKNCQKCELARGRTTVVYGVGSENATVMFVGEGPGFHEDKQGLPFVGNAGKLLDQMLESIGLSRDDVYITNVVKCRPPENRNPKPDEIEACNPYLKHQIEAINPKVICTLGNFATQTLLKKNVGITKLRGKAFQFDNHSIFPMLHPAAALHKGNLRQSVEEDFQNLKRFLESEGKPEPEEPKQMELF